VFRALLAKEDGCIHACIQRLDRKVSVTSLVEAGTLLQNDIRATITSELQKLKVALKMQPQPIASKAEVKSQVLLSTISKRIGEAEDAYFTFVA
jgi:hypothetical protein